MPIAPEFVPTVTVAARVCGKAKFVELAEELAAAARSKMPLTLSRTIEADAVTETRTDGIASVQYFEAGAFIGARQMYCCGAADSGTRFSAYWPHTAYFCPVCGEIWARAIYQFEFEYAPRIHSPWAIESRRCVEHGDGTLLTEQPLELCDKELLLREFYALLQRS
jgi:hypothetical protein